MNYSKAEITITVTDEKGEVTILPFSFEGNVSLVYDHQMPTIPTFTHLGGEATFKTTGTETLSLNIVNKTKPRVV